MDWVDPMKQNRKYSLLIVTLPLRLLFFIVVADNDGIVDRTDGYCDGRPMSARGSR